MDDITRGRGHARLPKVNDSDPVEFVPIDAYTAALLSGMEPPPNLMHEMKFDAYIYQREDGRWYHWPEETLF